MNWKVFSIASAIIALVSLWAIVQPGTAQTTMKSLVDWIAESLGWY